MYCDVMDLSEFVPLWGQYAYEYLTRPESEFQSMLGRMISSPEDEDEGGTIAAVIDDDDVLIGWARMSPWKDSSGVRWDALEAYTDEFHRGRGVAAFATAGLLSASDSRHVAVFRPLMILVARRAGFSPVLFERCTGWIRSE
jgi:hypothetical protein